MNPVQMLFTLGVIVFLIALLRRRSMAKGEVSNAMIFAGQHGDEMEVVSAAPWPQQLPGIAEISRYNATKKSLLCKVSRDGDLEADARLALRHALMDRCQIHVAWLLRFEREQRSIERMARRGMISETDFQKFSRFAECLDTEVNEVREEASWLCGDPERTRQASEEVWRVAVQIWHQRRHPGDKDGLVSSGGKLPLDTYEATKWPDEVPSVVAIRHYENLKASLLHENCTNAGKDYRTKLKEVLMERCRLQVPWMQLLQQERERARVATLRAQWQPCARAPTADDIDKLKDFEGKCLVESLKVREEAEWLGNQDGAPGLGGRIWPIAFELHAKVSTDHEKLLSTHHEKTFKFPNKPWPRELPGTTQRLIYEQLKDSTLKDLSRSAQGRSAPHVVSAEVSRQLRAALISRCQQMVPLLRRLQSEGRAFKIAAERGQLDDQDVACFLAIEEQSKAEIDAVKAEAEWLSDDVGTRDQIWPAAFEIYAKRRAQIAKQVRTVQHGQTVGADAVD